MHLLTYLNRITIVRKKGTNSILGITSSNTDRFSFLFTFTISWKFAVKLSIGGTEIQVDFRLVVPKSITLKDNSSLLAHSRNELMQWRGVRRLSVRPSVCKLLRKSLLLPGKWPDRHQTCTRWTPGQHASMVCSRSRSRSKVT